jgi:hypothetical protein
MTEQRHEAEEIVSALDVVGAARASLLRFGIHDLEAERRGAVHAMVRGSRALVTALDRFSECASAHTRGVHCGSGMDSEVKALTEALGDWIFAVRRAATLSRDASRVAGDVEVLLPRGTHAAMIEPPTPIVERGTEPTRSGGSLSDYLPVIAAPST